MVEKIIYGILGIIMIGFISSMIWIIVMDYKESRSVDVDQCMRIELFNSCMKRLPSGPQSTKYSDWDEVVNQCNRVSIQQSVRKVENIKPECR